MNYGQQDLAASPAGTHFPPESPRVSRSVKRETVGVNLSGVFVGDYGGVNSVTKHTHWVVLWCVVLCVCVL